MLVNKNFFYFFMLFSKVIIMTATNIWNRYPLVNNIKEVPLDDVVSVCYAQLHQKTEDCFILLTEEKRTLLLKELIDSHSHVVDFLSLLFVALELKNGSHIVITNNVCKKLKKRLDQGLKLSLGNQSDFERVIANQLLFIEQLYLLSY